MQLLVTVPTFCYISFVFGYEVMVQLGFQSLFWGNFLRIHTAFPMLWIDPLLGQLFLLGQLTPSLLSQKLKKKLKKFDSRHFCAYFLLTSCKGQSCIGPLSFSIGNCAFFFLCLK